MIDAHVFHATCVVDVHVLIHAACQRFVMMKSDFAERSRCDVVTFLPGIACAVGGAGAKPGATSGEPFSTKNVEQQRR